MRTSQLLTAFVSLVPGLAFAAASGTLVLSGTVPAVNTIVIAPNGANNTTLNITGGASNVNVAAVSETSNDPLGYRIDVTSINGGQLQLTTDATKKTAYQISYNGGAYVSPTTTAQTVKSVASLTAQATATSQVTVSVTAYPSALAGTYSDTLTVSIIAN